MLVSRVTSARCFACGGRDSSGPISFVSPGALPGHTSITGRSAASNVEQNKIANPLIANARIIIAGLLEAQHSIWETTNYTNLTNVEEGNHAPDGSGLPEGSNWLTLAFFCGH